jgi:hypothetical protein
MFFQKGVGALIRSRLQRFGQLKPNAQSIAQGMARSGSVTGELATLDLASASDMISLALCELLLPDDWFRVICELRSEGYRAEAIHGFRGTVKYAKVSSMGNGYTFELETLLFYVIACALGGLGNKAIHVYGDDIICPSSMAPDLAMLLFECGFWLNDTKSFIDGPFRESCGGHYYNGVDVTPFYFRKFPKHVAQLCVTSNAILRWCETRRWSDFNEFGPVVRMIRRAVPKKFWGPYGADGTLWSNWDESTPSWDGDTQSWKCARFVSKKSDVGAELPPEGVLLQAVWESSPDWTLGTLFEPETDSYIVRKFHVCCYQWRTLPVSHSDVSRS